MSKKISFKDLVQLNEDETWNQNRWSTSGQMAQRRSPETLTLVDILAQHRQGSDKHKQHPNNVKAPGPEIAGESPLVELLGDMMLQNEEIKKLIRLVATSPILEDRRKAKAKLNSIMNKLAAIDNVVKKVGEDIDDFRLEVHGD